MKVLILQGNPGDNYKTTRHNVGFLVGDTLARKYNADFSAKPKFFADIAETTIAGEKTLIVKPTTFYNETGKAARALIDFYKLDPAIDLLAIHDDLALPLGVIRTREKGSDAGNNGIKSLNAHLGHDYRRIRIGIYNEIRDRIDDAQFVLNNFTKDEAEALKTTIIPKTIELVEHFCADQLQTTSHTL